MAEIYHPFDWDTWEYTGMKILPLDKLVEEKVKEASSGAIASIYLVQGEELNYTLMVNGEEHGTINIPKDEFLKNVTYDSEEKFLHFYIETSTGEKVISIDASDIVLHLEEEVAKLKTEMTTLSQTVDTKGDTLSQDPDAGGINLKLKSGNTQLSTVTIPYADNPDVGDNYGGLMYKTDKDKLDGIEEEANKTIVDSALSTTSTNPVENKVVKTALDGKQDTLTFDNAPTANSNNPVKSGGIKTSLDSKADNDNIVRIADYCINETSGSGGTKGTFDIEFFNYDHIDPRSRRLFRVQIPIASIVDAGDGEIDAVEGIINWDDYLKLYNIEPEANKTIVDSALSTTSTNPVENKVVKSAVDTLSSDLTALQSTVETIKSQIVAGVKCNASQTAAITANGRITLQIPFNNIPANYKFGAYRSVNIFRPDSSDSTWENCLLQSFGTSGGGTKTNLKIKNIGEQSGNILVECEALFVPDL